MFSPLSSADVPTVSCIYENMVNDIELMIGAIELNRQKSLLSSKSSAVGYSHNV